VCIIEHYSASLSYAHFQAELQETYPSYPVSCKNTAAKMTGRLHESESVNDQKCCGSNGLLTDKRVESIRQPLLLSATKLLRKAVWQAGTSDPSAQSTSTNYTCIRIIVSRVRSDNRQGLDW
jgi:hypothetical protein